MKNYISVFVALAAITLFSCSSDDLEVKTLKLHIEAEKTTVEAGEVVSFKIDGAVDYITFYSGEEGHMYEHRERNLIVGGMGQLSFTTITAPVNTNETLKLCFSTDFDGEYNFEAIEAATWTDITDKAIWSTAPETESGFIDITEFAGLKPMFFGFKYVGVNGVVQPAWIVRKINVEYKVGERAYPIIRSMMEADFKFAYPKGQNTVDREWTYNVQQIRTAAGTLTSPNHTGWAVSKAFHLNKVDPDRGEAIVNMTNKLKEFRYIFTELGTYKVVFDCKNASIKGESALLKEITITVTPAVD